MVWSAPLAAWITWKPAPQSCFGSPVLVWIFLWCDVVLITRATQLLRYFSSRNQLDGWRSYKMLIQFPYWNHLPTKYGQPSGAWTEILAHHISLGAVRTESKAPLICIISFTSWEGGQRAVEIPAQKFAKVHFHPVFHMQKCYTIYSFGWWPGNPLP